MEQDLSKTGVAEPAFPGFLPLPDVETEFKKSAVTPSPIIFARTEPQTYVNPLLEKPSQEMLRAIQVQKTVGWLLLLPFCTFLVFLMRVVRGYKIENMKEIRARFQEIAKEPGPLMICANHLTFIDSALMIWALASNPFYVRNHRFFAWNLPAGDFFKKKFHFRVVAYLSKCIFIHRDGNKEHKHGILKLCRHLLEKGEIVSIFPEGRRSRVGRFDVEHLTHGAGKLVTSLKDCRVLCIYVRGHRQEGYTNYPVKGSRFHILMDVIKPEFDPKNRRAHVDVVKQIGQTLHRLENQFYASKEEFFR